jgi:hypothetical protein
MIKKVLQDFLLNSRGNIQILEALFGGVLVFGFVTVHLSQKAIEIGEDLLLHDMNGTPVLQILLAIFVAGEEFTGNGAVLEHLFPL